MYISGGVIGMVRGSLRSCHKMVVYGSYQCLCFTELVLLYSNVPNVSNHSKTLIQDTKILRMFLLLVIKKYINRIETKITDVDLSIVGQNVRPLENNYLKACLIFRLNVRD